MRAPALLLGLGALALACGAPEKKADDPTSAANAAPVTQVVLEKPVEALTRAAAAPAAPASAMAIAGEAPSSDTSPAPIADAASADAAKDADTAPIAGAAQPPITEGKPRAAPSFALPSLTTTGKVGPVKGKVVIVDFWATWCAPCQKSFPKLQELYAKYRASGLEIASVCVDEDQTEIAAFARAHGAQFPIGWDSKGKVAGQYKPDTMPSTYVIDKTGVIRHVHKGYHDGEIGEIEREIKKLL